jgi:hypothetical protein
MKIQSAKAGIGTGRAGLQAASGLFSNAGLFDKGVKSFHPNDLDPYLLFDAESSMIGTLENPTLDLDPSKQDTLDVITATRAGTATFTDANGLIASASPNTVRVDYVDGVPMILVEPSATNLLPNSSSFENVNGSVQTTGFEAPDGSNDAKKISNINGATDPMVAWSSLATLSPSTQYSGSIFVKGNAGESIRFYLRRAFGGAMANSPFINVVLTGSWQSVEIGSMTTASDNNNGRIFIFQASSGTPADEVYLWGGQIETGSVSTSVIPTSGSTVTRAADKLEISGSDFSDFFNTGGDGTFYVEFETKDAFRDFYILNGQNPQSRFFYSNWQNRLYSYDGAHSLVFGNVPSGLSRAAISYNSSNQFGSLNGSAMTGTTTHNGNLSNLTKLCIGSFYDNTDHLLGHIKRVLYWPVANSNL